jgi:hypothetical protein
VLWSGDHLRAKLYAISIPINYPKKTDMTPFIQVDAIVTAVNYEGFMANAGPLQLFVSREVCSG